MTQKKRQLSHFLNFYVFLTVELPGDEGRILVRPSGTEPLVHVMVEAKSDALCHDYVYRIVDYIKEHKL